MDRECGSHSGIPKCCIEFFVTKWWPLCLVGAIGPIEDRQAVVKHRARLLGVEFRHVPCDACLETGNTIELKPCPPDCWKSTLPRRRLRR
jgi:hypothetical protein